MKKAVCDYEETVRRAAASGGLDAELEAHAESCPDCRETLRLSGWLRSAVARQEPPRLPTAGQLWWKALILRRLADPDPRIESATRPARWGMGIGGVAACVILVLSLAFVLGRMRAIVAGLPVEPPASWVFVAMVAAGLPVAALLTLFFLVFRES